MFAAHQRYFLMWRLACFRIVDILTPVVPQELAMVPRIAQAVQQRVFQLLGNSRDHLLNLAVSPQDKQCGISSHAEEFS